MDAVMGCEMLRILKKTISYRNKKISWQKQKVPQSLMHSMQLSDQSLPLWNTKTALSTNIRKACFYGTQQYSTTSTQPAFLYNHHQSLDVRRMSTNRMNRQNRW
jgi:hypothetical protein